MHNHRYVKKSRLQKAKDVIKENGWLSLIKKLIKFAQYRILFHLSPLLIFTKRKMTFKFQDKHYPYFFHKHNLTWRNERAVEVSLSLHLLNSYQGKQILEVGNVLSHYIKTNWEILDKFEKGKGVQNVDVIDFCKPDMYDLIISISTLEHVGFDDDQKDSKKIDRTVEVMKKNLKKGGLLFITCPIGYNPHLDEKLAHNILEFSEEHFLIRSDFTRWEKGGKKEALLKKFDSPYTAANALFIGVYRRQAME